MIVKNSFILFFLVAMVSNMFANQLTKLSDGLSSPVGMAFDSKKNLYITNWGSSTISLWDGKTLKNISNDIPSPSGIAIDKDDTIYIASYSSGKIYQLDKNYHTTVFMDGLSTMAGLSFDLEGNLLVAHRGKSEILKITKDKKIESFINKGLTTPVAIQQISNKLYIINDITGYVYQYNDSTNKLFLLSDKISAPAIGLVYKDETIYIPDYGDRGIYKIDLKTRQLQRIEKETKSPVALAFYNNQLYIGTWGDNTLYKLELIEEN